MADEIQSNIRINVDTAAALASIKNLQANLSVFYTQMSKSGAAANAVVSGMQSNLLNTVNASGKFAANIQTIKSTTESFNTALEKNKFSIGEYFRYAGASSKSFGKLFKTEYDTITKVAEERVKTLQTQYIKLGRDANGALKSIAVRPLTLDMENLSTKTQMAAQKQQLLNQLLKQGSTQLLNWGKNTQWAGRQLMVGFSIPLMMLGSAATKAYDEIEKASVKISRVYGDMNTTAKETSNMVNQIKNLASEYTKYGVAVSDTMQMAADAAAMGKTGADLLAQVNAATRLSVLGGVDQSKALQTSISLTNAFGISTAQLSDKINYLNAVENQTVLSIDDMTTAIPKAAPVIKQLGGNVEDLAFFLTAMKEGGVNASEGANAIKSGLSALINPTKKASDFLAGFGINIKGIVEADKGNIKKTVIDFANALNTLDPLNRARAIEQMFGKFQFARMSTLFKNVTDQSSQASKALELANMSGIQRAALARQELDKIQSSPMYKFQKAMADLQLKLAPIGETFLKAVTPVVNVVGDILTRFDKLSDGAKSFIVGTIAVIGGLAPVILMTVGLIANGAANVLKFLAGIKNFFNKTTSASEVLGETTNYMTQEQLKAEAVAASLNQVHTNLKQTFTAEADAVNLYTNALKKAVEAAQALNGVPAKPVTTMPVVPVTGPYSAKGRLPRGNAKFAEGGIISGPGTGTSDSIPAMVSNGEAIIPAATVKRFPGLVNGLIAGKIGGFRDGKYSNITMKSSVQQGHLEEAFTGTFQQVYDKILSGFKEGTKEYISAQEKLYQNRAAALKQGAEKGLTEEQVLGANWKSYSENTMRQSAVLNNANGKPVSGMPELEFYKTQGPATFDNFAKHLKDAGIPFEKITQVASGELLSSLESLAAEAKAAGKEFVVTEQQISEIANKALSTAVSGDAGAQAVLDDIRSKNRTVGRPEFNSSGSTSRYNRNAIAGGSYIANAEIKKRNALMESSGMEVAGKGQFRIYEGGESSIQDKKDLIRKAEASDPRLAAKYAKQFSKSASGAEDDQIVKELKEKIENLKVENKQSKEVQALVQKEKVETQSSIEAEKQNIQAVEENTVAVKEDTAKAKTSAREGVSGLGLPIPQRPGKIGFGGASGFSSVNTSGAISATQAAADLAAKRSPFQNKMAASMAAFGPNLQAEKQQLLQEWQGIVTPIKQTVSEAKQYVSQNAAVMKVAVKEAFSAYVSEPVKANAAVQQAKSILTVARGNLAAEAVTLKGEWQQIVEPIMPTVNKVKTAILSAFDAIRTQSYSILPNMPGRLPQIAPTPITSAAPGMANRIVQYQTVGGSTASLSIAGKYLAEFQRETERFNARLDRSKEELKTFSEKISFAFGKIGAASKSAAAAVASGANKIKTSIVSAVDKMATGVDKVKKAAVSFGQKATDVFNKIKNSKAMTYTGKDLVNSAGFTQFSGALNKLGAAASGAMFALSMIPGPIGDFMNSIMPFVFLLSSITPILSLFKDLTTKNTAATVLETAAKEKEALASNLAAGADINEAGDSTIAANADLVEAADSSIAGVADTGEAAATGLAAVAAFALSLPLLPLVAGIVALGAVIAGVAFAFNAASEAAKKEAEQRNALAKFNSDKVRTDALKQVGELTGTTIGETTLERWRASRSGLTRKQQSDKDIILNSQELSDPSKGLGAMAASLKKLTSSRAIKNALLSFAVELSANGVKDESIKPIVEAIKEKAGKTSITLDFSAINLGTEKGRKTAFTAQTAADISELNKKGKGYTETAGQDSLLVLNKAERAKTVKSTAISISNLADAFRNGKITGQQYSQSLGDITTGLKGIEDEATKAAVIRGLFQTAGMDADGLASSVKDVNTQMQLLSANALLGSDFTSGVMGKASAAAAAVLKAKGVTSPSQAVGQIDLSPYIGKILANDPKFKSVKALQEYVAKQSGAAKTPTGGSTSAQSLIATTTEKIEAMTIATKMSAMAAKKGWSQDFISALEGADKATRDLYVEMVSGIPKLKPLGEVLKKVFDRNVITEATRAMEEFRVATTKASTDAADQVALKNELIAAGLTAAEAASAAADENNLKEYKSGKTLNKKADAIVKIVELNKINKKLEKDMLSIEEKANDEAQKALENIQAKADQFAAEKGMAELNAKKSMYDDALSIITAKEDELNKIYDERTAALDKIQNAQEAIAAAQQDQLTIADAITKGDIAAAAKAAQDARNNAASKAMSDQKTALDTAKQNQLDALTVAINGKTYTRKQLESNIADIQSQIYAIQLEQDILYGVEIGRLTDIANKKAAILKLSQQISGTVTTEAPAKIVVTQTDLDLQAAVRGLASGKISPLLYKATGGFIAKGTDTIPAMLSPGEFVVNKAAVNQYGLGIMDKINSGQLDLPSFSTAGIQSGTPTVGTISSNVDNSSVYNNTYSININATGAQDPDALARVVINKIRDLDGQRVRGVRI